MGARRRRLPSGYVVGTDSAGRGAESHGGLGIPPDDHEGIHWHKTNKHKGNSAIGMGHMTRANSEDCLFAVRGKLPARMDASICQHVTAPRLENSRKPDVIREKLVQLLGDVPRIELFARQSSHGFDVWGNQCSSPAVELLPGCAVPVVKTEAA